MPYKTNKIPIADPFLKRSSKLLPCQKERIHYLYNDKGVPMTMLSTMFNVSRKAIEYILFPDRLKKNQEKKKERGGHRLYYDKEKHNKQSDNYVKFKYQLFNNIKS